MTKKGFSIVLLLLSCYFSYAQEQAPAIEWVEPYNGGNRGGSITAFPGPNALFALIKAQNSISGSASISKFYADGLVKNQFIFAEGGSSNAPTMSQYASQDGGVLVYLFLSRTLRKYDAGLNLSWQKTFDYTILSASATLDNGFYMLTSGLNPLFQISRVKNDGSIEWSVDITAFINNIGDIQTSSDGGVIITTGNGVRKYSATGQLMWANTDISGGYQLITGGASIIYLLSTNSLLNIRNIIQLNTSTGNINWTRPLAGEYIVDFERTSDNGCVFSTDTGVYKYNVAGDLQWKNTNYGSAKIATTGDSKIFVIKNNTIIKLTFANEQVWAKSFNSDNYIIQDIHGASDFGLYATAVKNGISFTTAPDYILFKLAPPVTPCKSTIHITGDTTVTCNIGTRVISSTIGNASLEYTNLLTDIGFQWKRNDIAIPSATTYSYTASQAGRYSLSITQKQCEATSSAITLSQIIIPQPEIKQSNDSLISSALVGNKWYLNGTELPFTSQKIKFTEVGNYQVKVFEKNCESVISANFIPIILANEEASAHIQIYPNPASDKAFIKSTKAFSYQLIDVTGRLLNQSVTKSFSHTIDLNRFSSGNYFVILQEENGNSFVRKLSINR
ncbi:T9SS type A sorting domain-containing protein [Emticicia sp. BO119]|uniref:T9SS type A sorting domain-containing protein n=1 Tax=Emticicia sp. BO119 TaxID=2757768 RepID=UPI0015F0540D|nr:T9SS type A sorting domain-containing protein [Emticicia sp. BO119]MBA4850274.1 T9SS type A sorting domain-containing protein [Emticicia sp. BO119]